MTTSANLIGLQHSRRVRGTSRSFCRSLITLALLGQMAACAELGQRGERVSWEQLSLDEADADARYKPVSTYLRT